MTMIDARLLVDRLPNRGTHIQHRFVFDKAARNHVEYLLNSIFDQPFEQALQWAKPPYDLMYIQFDEMEGDGNTFSLGCVIKDDGLILMMDDKNGKAFLVPLMFSMTYNEFYDPEGNKIDHGSEDAQAIVIFIFWIIGAILILNRPSTHKVNRVDHKSAIVKGKRVVYKAHNTVTIDIAEVGRLKQEHFNTGSRGTYRRHEVRGSWVHYHKHPSCEHTFIAREVKEPDPDRPRYICSKCGQYRTWRPAFERGDASKGWASKNYNVTSTDERFSDDED